MQKLVLFIATSLDGYIARPDGAIDWLEGMYNPDNSDHGYVNFISTIGSTVMGRATYDVVMGFGVEWPYKGIDSYVLSRKGAVVINSPDTQLVLGDAAEFVKNLKGKAEKDIWLIGGGELVNYFLNERLIDRMIITIIPHTIGAGIRLFPGQSLETLWTLVDVEKFASGAVNLTYDLRQA